MNGYGDSQSTRLKCGRRIRDGLNGEGTILPQFRTSSIGVVVYTSLRVTSWSLHDEKVVRKDSSSDEGTIRRSSSRQAAELLNHSR